MNKITLEQLKEHGACLEQMLLFKELFGKEVKVTVKRCVKYYNKFDWEWAAEHLLSNKMCKEYLNIRQLAWEEYLKIRRSAYKEYEKIEQLAYKKYEKYFKIKQLAREEYLKKRAQAFGECYLRMDEE